MTEITKHFLTESRSFLSKEYLPKIRRCLELLTEEEIWWRPNGASNSVGNLLLHLEGSTRTWIISVAGNTHQPRNRQQEFDEREQIPRAQLLARLEQMLAEADEVLTRIDTEALLQQRKSPWEEVTVLRAIYHAVEHFSMHTGQILMLTKMRLGDDLNLTD